MRKILTQLITAISLVMVLLVALQANAQRRYALLDSSDFSLTLENDEQTAGNILEFDVYLRDTDATEAFELGTVQAGILVNPAIYNGGTISLSIVAGSSELVTAQQPTSVVWSQAQNTIKLTPRPGPGAGNATIISTTYPGTRVCRLRITNTVDFTANSTADMLLNFTTVPYPTKVSQYIGSINTPLVTSETNCFSNLDNIVLNPDAIAPTAYAVTGGGSYCQGTDGLPVGLAGSEVGVTYTLYKDAVAQVPTVAGTGDAISFGNQLFGTYTVTGTNGGGTTPMSGSAVITENPTVAASVIIAPDANNICEGTSVTFTASPVGGGSTPAYQWFKNSVAVATGDIYSYVPINGDAVYVVMTSDATCATGSPATSNTVTMMVNPTVAASVTISVNQNNVNPGTTVTFTATPVGGGTTPTYQWFKNTVAVATGVTYSYIPVNGDVVYVVMTSDAPCATGSPATSNSITMLVISGISDFILTLENDEQTAGNILEFDVYLRDTDATDAFELGTVQAGILVNPVIYNGGTISLSIVAGSSELVTAQQPTSVVWSQAQNTIKLTPRPGPGAGNATIISTTYPGTRVCRLRITNTVDFTANSTADMLLNFTTVPYPTKVSQYIGSINTPLVTSETNCFSNLDNIVLNPDAIAPTAYAVTGGGSYCQGTDGLPVGLAGSEVGVTYTLYKDAVAQVPTVAGTGDAISFGNQLFGTYIVTGTNGGGTTPMSGSAVITETATLPVSVSISTSQNNVCSGTSVTLTAIPVNSGTPTYQWYKNASPAGSNQATYTYTPANNDQVYVIMTSDLDCVTGNPATSNTVVLIVNELLPVSVSVVADQNNVCSGTSVTLTATPVNGGTPTYHWYVNAAPVGSNQTTFTYVPLNNDEVYVVITSDQPCVTGSPAASNFIVFNVADELTPSVTISASENPVNAGSPVTFTPTPVNGGTPTYQWFVNGSFVGTETPYTYTPEDGDQVYAEMASSLECITAEVVVSNTILMDVVTGIDINDIPGLKVYSADKVIYLESTAGLTGEASVYDIAGRKLITRTLLNETKTLIPASSLSNGAYIVKISNGNSQFNTKVFIR